MTRIDGAGRRFRAGLVVWGVLAGGAVAAPPCPIDNCATIPRGAVPAPNGSYVRAWQNVIAAEAEADDFVIYRHEWFEGGWVFGPYGSYHLREIAKRLPHVPFPVVIQPGAVAEVNAVRREVVVRELQRAGIADAAARVVIDFPQAAGLSGDEAERAYPRMIRGHSGTGVRGTGAAPYAGFGGSLGFSPR